MDDYVYGIHAIDAVLTQAKRRIHQLYVNKTREDKRLSDLLAKAVGIPVTYLSLEQMNDLFKGVAHQGLAARADKLPTYGEKDITALLASSAKKSALVLVLDGITDPHNVGACLRSADATGVDFVIIPKDKNASLTPTVSKVACGAAESIPLVRVVNLARALMVLKQQGVWIYGAAGEASTSLYALDLKGPVALVLGAEDKGMRRLTRERCDQLFALPMVGQVSSLNVSVATGVCLYEVLRQRQALY